LLGFIPIRTQGAAVFFFDLSKRNTAALEHSFDCGRQMARRRSAVAQSRLNLGAAVRHVQRAVTAPSRAIAR
jgi:hypothetical protein